MSARLAPVVVIAIVVAACGNVQAPTVLPSPTPSDVPTPSLSAPPSSTPTPSGAPASLLLKVTSEGGFINPAANLAALPAVAVYADGRILTPGPLPAIEPGPLLPSVQVRDVGAHGAAAVLAAIKDAGLDQPSTGSPGVPGDTGVDVFTVVVNGATTTTRVVGGGPPGAGTPGGSGSGDHRAAALALLDRLLDPSETWGAPAAANSTYSPVAYRVYVAPGGPPADPSTTQAPVAWPLTGLDAFGTPANPDRGIAGLRQGVVLGSDADRLAPLLRSASVLTPFTSGGRSYTLYVRPLLPDEIGG